MTEVVTWQSAAFLGASCTDPNKCSSAEYVGGGTSKTTRLYQLEAQGSGKSNFIFGSLELNGMSNAPCTNGSYHDICVTNMTTPYDQITVMPVDENDVLQPNRCSGTNTSNDVGMLYYNSDLVSDDGSDNSFSDSIILVDKNFCQHKAPIIPSAAGFFKFGDTTKYYGFCLQNTHSQQKCSLGDAATSQENEDTSKTPWYFWIISLVVFILVIGFASLLVWFRK